jgi:transposase
MATNQSVLVDVPSGDGVHIKTAGAKGEKYVYKYVKYFRNDDGEPRNKAKSIGKLDVASGKMYPNSNYYELFRIDPALPDVDVWDYGYSYTVLHACRELGLLDCLLSAFGACAMDIVVMAAYIIREGGAMDGIDDWQQRNYFPKYSRLLTSQSTSKMFSELDVKKTSKFFVEWIKSTVHTCAVCYDVTSISSYSQNMTSVERGYNRDGEKLAQFNLGLFCNESNRMPLYYNRYNGSLTDKTNLSYVLDNAKEVGIQRVKMVMDGGFWDENCLASLHGLCEAFTVGLPTHLKESQKIIETYGRRIENYANKIGIPHTYCIPVETTVWGVKGKAFLYFDSLSHAHLTNEMSELIDRLSAELAAIKKFPKNKLKRYSTYFCITKNDSGFEYSVDVEKVEKIRRQKGFYLIFTTDMNASAEETLQHYRAKDATEKLFDQIKCDMDGNRVRTHNESTTDGKVFVTFIACIIRTFMLENLGKYLTGNSTSLKKALNQMSNIRIITSARGGYRFTKALSKKQKDILKSFGGSDKILASLD